MKPLKICLVFTLMTGWVQFSHGQLINPGFEVCSAYPSSAGQWHLVQGWNNAGSALASPDYFHYSGTVEADIPETPVAIVNAYEGNALMGFIACGRKNSNIREYLTAVLSQPMIEGKNYRVSFEMTNGQKTILSPTGLGVDQIGLFFSITQPQQNEQSPLMETPNCRIENVFYSPEWKKMSFVFYADKPYRFMTLGLFGDDTDKNITEINGVNPQYAYYFVDDFSLELITDNPTSLITPDQKNPDTFFPHALYSPSRPVYMPNSFTPNGDAHNDVLRPVAGYITAWEFSVYTRWGEKIFSTTDEQTGWDGTVDSKTADNGVYIWEIVYLQDQQDNGKAKKIQRGTVNLIR